MNARPSDSIPKAVACGGDSESFFPPRAARGEKYLTLTAV